MCHLSFRPLADYIELPFQSVLVHAVGAANEDLLDVRLRVARQTANRVAVDGSVPPTQNGETFFARDLFQDAFAKPPFMPLHGQERHAHSVFARGRQAEAQTCALSFEKGMRDLDENARPIARIGIAPAGSTMSEVDQNLDSLEDDVVAFLAGDISHESDAAGIVLKLRVIETLRAR